MIQSWTGTPQHYIDIVMPSIAGWLSHDDAVAMLIINDIQKSLGITGQLLELGVYQGRTLALMGLFAGKGEDCVGIDLFTLGRASQEETWKTLEAAQTKATLVVSNTAAVSADDMDNVRMLHVDADHSYDAVFRDLCKFAPTLSRGGVLIVDDYHQRCHPGVQAATCDFQRGSPLVPFLSSENKMFLCHRSMGYVYVSHLNSAAEYEGKSRVESIRGSPIFVANSKNPMTQEQCAAALEAMK